MSHNKKTRILFIINALDVGGAEKMLLDLCKYLDKNRYELAVSTVMGSGPLEPEFKATGAKIYINKKKNRLGLGMIKTQKKIIKDFQPDIVHTHLFSGDTWGRLAAISLGHKLIVTTEHNRNLQEGAIKKSIKHFLSYFTSVIVASSEAIKAYSVKKEFISGKKIRVIYYGIDLKRFAFRGVQVARYGENHLKFVSVGRLTHQKGQRFLIEAMAKLDDLYPEIKLEIAGQGPDRDKLLEVAKTVHVADKVRLVGTVDTAEFLKTADIFVLPSIYEGLGIVLLEAMATGVPVIAADIPAVDEIVHDQETGLLFEVRNSDDLVDKILYLLKDVDLQEQMIKKARQMVEEKFSVERMVAEYDDLYQEMMGHRREFEIKY